MKYDNFTYHFTDAALFIILYTKNAPFTVFKSPIARLRGTNAAEKVRASTEIIHNLWRGALPKKQAVFCGDFLGHWIMRSVCGGKFELR